MSEKVYRQLAQQLNAIPNGFSPTQSGVELSLLAKMFTPDEAALASVMRLTQEPAADIAGRVGADPDESYKTLKMMAREGLIRAKKREGQLVFGLMPFVVGIYEEQLPRMDAELAGLFEQYYLETQGGSITHDAPAVHRVIPVEKSVSFDTEIFPYERASELLESARSWGVRDCICRVQQKLIGKGCEHPVENCMMLAPVENAFDHSKTTRPISKEEAFRILREAEESGLVHSTANQRDQIYYICNCCTCCCGITRSVVEFGIPTAIAHSDFRAVVDAQVCSGCNDCLEYCQFGALSVPDDVCIVSYAHCVGCGQCVTACSTGSLYLERRAEGDIPQLPADIKAWMLQRAAERDISIFDIL